MLALAPASRRHLPALLALRPLQRARFAATSMSGSQDKNDDAAHIDRGEHPHAHQLDTSTEGEHGWKTRAPYRIHEPNDNFDVKYEANCHCERVHYQISREAPLDSKLCHCTTCQTQHAAPFQWAAIFHKEDINFTRGHHALEWYDPSSKSIEHVLPCKVRCAFCHSPIMDEGRNMVLLFPSLVHLKTQAAKDAFRARCHIFYEQRVVDVPDGLPKWSGLDKKSELIEDSPVEAVRERQRAIERERREKEERDDKEEQEEKK